MSEFYEVVFKLIKFRVCLNAVIKNFNVFRILGRSNYSIEFPFFLNVFWLDKVIKNFIVDIFELLSLILSYVSNLKFKKEGPICNF
jgi:hypothetical protein